MAVQNVNEESVKKFKSDVVGACPSLVTLQEQYVARSIPQSVFESVFRNVFNGDSKLARDVVYNRFDRIKDDVPEREVERIETLLPASIKIANTIRDKSPMLLISDIDNDGSLSQAMTMEMARLTGHQISVSPKDYDPANHGFSLSQINNWVLSQGLRSDDKFLVMVTDLGTNQRDDQLAFLEKYPNADLIVADHHKPDVEMMMRNDNDRALLVSPFVKGSIRLGLRGGGGVSGGYLSYKMFKHALLSLRQTKDLELTDLDFENRLEPLKSMGKAANLLDRVECDIRLKPLHEKEVKKALDVSSLTNKGRIVGKWLSSEQVSNIKELGDLIGEEAVDSLISIRTSLMEQNHIAWSLNEIMPKIVSLDDDGDDEKIKNVANEIAVLLNTVAMEENSDINYIELLRPHVFNLNYENQFEGALKKSWLSIAKKMMRDVGKLEKDILKQIRDYQLVKEISDDFITITQSASHAVSKVFTTKQLASAYHSLTKPVNMNVSRSTLGEVVLSYRTEVPISELMSNVESVLPGVNYSIRGHDNVGGLSLKLPMGADPKEVLKTLAENLNSTAKRAIDNKPLAEAFEVKPIHLSILKEMLKKMRVDMSPESEPVMLMKITPNMTFEDTKTLEKQTVSRLVERKEWETTTESLDFAMTSSLILPNQALKTIANDGFDGALKISLLPNGTYIANKAVTGAQLRQMKVSNLRIPLQKEQEELKHEYLTRFASPDVTKVKVPRKAVMNALNFTADGEGVFHNTEATLLGILNETKKDSYVVLDVEAEGGGNAKCYQLGLAIYTKVEDSGHLLNGNEFRDLVKSNSDKINNFRKIEEDSYLVNEKLELSLVSLVISKDGSEPIRISFKSQNLTNIDQDFLDEVGMSAEEAQNKLMAAVSDIGEFIIQAHNLPYDDKIVAVNFPEFHKVMSEAVHLDTAPLAMRNQIAYTNVQVNTIDGVEFFNAEHEGYNLSTLMEKEESFDFPSIKGGVVLQVRGDVVQRLDLETRITTKLNMTRDELSGSLRENMAPIKTPKYGIAKLLKMAALHDLISRQPLKKIKRIEFESMGAKELPAELWEHFQEYYSYDLTPAQNVAKFSVLPDVQDYLGSSDGMKFESLADVDPRLLEARNQGTAGSYNPEKKLRSKKEQELHKEKVSTFSLSDVLNANAINFVKANPENAERFARAWVYELVLDHYEPSRKNMPKSFIDGVSEMTGVMGNMVSTVFDETYIYKNFREIQTYLIHEPHSNIGLYSDTVLEVNVFAHMLGVKLRNPFITGENALKYDMNPAEPMVKAMVKQAAESTVRKDLKITLREVLEDDVVNNYSAKQLDQFSKDGISIATNRTGVAKMKCKTLSSNDTAIHIELPEFSAEEWRNMPSSERFELEEQVETAVTTLLLHNSKDKKKAKPNGTELLVNVSSSDGLIDNLKEIQEFFGKMVPTQREALFKKVMKLGIDAIVGNEKFKLPINKELRLSDLDLISEAFKNSIENLRNGQNFESYVTHEEISDFFENAKAEYLAFSHLMETGEKLSEVTGYEPLTKTAKAQLTRQKTALDGVSQLHFDASPDLTKGILNTKDDPMDFLIKSPLVSNLICSNAGLDRSVDNDLKLDNEINRPKKPGI